MVGLLWYQLTIKTYNIINNINTYIFIKKKTYHESLKNELYDALRVSKFCVVHSPNESKNSGIVQSNPSTFSFLILWFFNVPNPFVVNLFVLGSMTFL